MPQIELNKLLRLHANWYIVSSKLDASAGRVDILIRQREAAPEAGLGKTITLRHLPLAGLRTYLQVPITDLELSATASSFTTEMEAYILNILRHSDTTNAAAKLADITEDEAKAVRDRANQKAGTSNLIRAPIFKPITPAKRSITEPNQLVHTSKIPLETHDCWQKFINGEIPIRSGFIALQMLLQRVRQNIATNQTESTRLNNVRILRQYFIKNESRLQPELNILTAATPATTPPSPTTVTDLPGITHPCWEQIVNGTLNISTNHLGLQMMVERTRLSAESNPSQALKSAAANILYRFFAKHKNYLQTEIYQLSKVISSLDTAPVFPTLDNVSAISESANSILSIPPASDPVWQRIITKQIIITTNTDKLKMMMGHIQQSVERNPSQTSKMVAATTLHKFFTKYQNHLQMEISQICKAAKSLTTETTSPLLPATDASWLKLINGELAVKTDSIALQMMLERLRISIQKSPTQATKIAGVKILRQYFLKHQNHLQTEIQQLNQVSASLGVTTMQFASDTTLSLPPVTDASWLKLINGELSVRTDLIALQMMLERLRISIQKNPTQATKTAGAKILRQYFLKHQNKHQAELSYLLASGRQ